MRKHPKPEWSFVIEVEKLGATATHYNIAPDEDARAGLCARFDLLDLQNVTAHLTLTRERGGHIIHVTGNLSADVVQECVATLVPVPAHVTDEFEAYYAEPAAPVSFEAARAKLRAKAGEGEQEMVDEVDAPEPIIDGVIDLGELVAQFISLALPPYPRSPDAPPVVAEIPPSHQIDVPDGPFAGLQEWKDGL